jgi:hypothetical protein
MISVIAHFTQSIQLELQLKPLMADSVDLERIWIWPYKMLL